jgi:transcriptional regulator with XRE-family HTH domain
VTTITFGQRLRQLRREAKLTLLDLADDKGCTIVYISAIERGEKNPPSPKVIEAILKKLGRLDLLDEMLLLALRSRKSIEIQLHDKSPEAAEMLACLARRVEQGDMPPELASEVLDLLKKGDKK